MEKITDISQLEAKARVVRRHIIEMTGTAGSGHPGGSLSAADIVTALYFNVMNHRPEDPSWPERDRFVLSKGHAAPVLYAALAETGYFPVSDILSLRCLGSTLQGHPDMCKTPGVEICSGSLGQGLAAACGMAAAARMDRATWRVYAMIGDGESQEGEIWEASMFAAHYHLDNLTAVLDFNGLQIDGPIEDVMSIGSPRAKWEAFDWHVIEIDGHDFGAILAAMDEARDTRGKPTMIVARTVKGKGVSFMENIVDFHGKAPTKEQMLEALRELDQ